MCSSQAKWRMAILSYGPFSGLFDWLVLVLDVCDCRPPVIRVSDKVVIPQDDHPDINFVGLLIGPRGNTLKNLEKEVR